ncbi:hypothetical protein TNCV_1946471 [Trichonephila clavipes]|uniref:Uncharacterized protein n=1 Tax=Trichonephila clavipes TaxID=2585209 RepID=A0A8X6V9L5_TRICX|nr:hypothetical protein TNCV_1946471 [Trichonephila clavipes]
MKDVTLKFIKRVCGLFLKVAFFRYPQRKKSRIDKSGKKGGQSNLEMTRSSKNSVKTSILFTMDALPDRFLCATDPGPRNRCTKSVIVDVFGVVSPGYFC